MQKKKSTKFKKVDLAIILLCIAGSISSGIAFVHEYTRTLTKLNETPVGTITFKRRVAQRKFIDRTIWDRLKQSSPLYNGDTIRTIEFSEAIIIFRDEVTRLSMNENTLIQIFYDDVHGARINFSDGNVNVLSGSNSVTVTADSSEVVVQGGAALNRRNRNLSVSVMEGQVSYNGERLQTGSILSVNEDGQRDLTPVITMTYGSPSVSSTALTSQNPVTFSWISSNFNNDTIVITEIARDRNFRQIVGTAEAANNVSTAAINVSESGTYWWRAYPAAGNRQPANPIYPTGSLEIIPRPISLPAPIIAEPEPVRQPEPAPVIVQPEPRRPDPAPVIVQPEPEPVRQPEPEPEPVPLIVRPEPPRQPEPVIQPEPVPLIVQPEPVIQPEAGTIRNTLPIDGYIIVTEQIRRTPSIHFSWEGDTSEYLFSLYRANGEVVIPPTNINRSAFILSEPGILTEGEYIWHVHQIPYTNDSNIPDAVNHFTIRNEPFIIRTLPSVNPGELYGLE